MPRRGLLNSLLASRLGPVEGLGVVGRLSRSPFRVFAGGGEGGANGSWPTQGADGGAVLVPVVGVTSSGAVCPGYGVMRGLFWSGLLRPGLSEQPPQPPGQHVRQGTGRGHPVG